MDLGLSEQQELLKNAAREFLENECPEQHVREMEEDERGYSPELWGQMAEQGWQGLLIPEEHGGAGFDFLDLCVLLEEFGRAWFLDRLCPVVLVARARSWRPVLTLRNLNSFRGLLRVTLYSAWL